MKLDRRTILIAVMFALLVGFAGWSVSRMFQYRHAVQAAEADLVESTDLVQQILSLRDRPVMAGASEIQLTALARFIEHAADQARMQEDQLDQIWPEAARRKGDGDYQEKPTRVLIHQVSLEQLMRFMHAITHAEYELTVTALRLTAPRSGVTEQSQQGPERWTAEMTLSYLIYSPPDTGRSSQVAHTDP